MTYSGPCPRCNEQLRFVDLPLPGERCNRCGEPLLAMMLDAELEDGVVPVELIAYEPGDRDRDPWAPARTARQLIPVLAAWILMVCLGVVTLLILGFGLALVSVESSSTGMLFGVLSFGALLAMGVAAVGRQVLKQPGDTVGFARFRSIFSVLAGGVMLLSAILIAWFGWRLVPDAAKNTPLGIPLGLLFYLAPSVVAGWVVARFAPSAPVRHALALALLLPLLALCATFGSDVAEFTLAPVVLLHCLPGILIGVWIRSRDRARPEATPTA